MFAQDQELSHVGRPVFRAGSKKRPVTFQGQILLIENLRERRQLMSDMLAQERFEVGAVEDARDAIQLLSEGLPSGQGKMPELILCNARMLGDAGLEALARLCQGNPGLPVVLLNAFTTPRMRERMARIQNARILDQFFDLEDVRLAVVSLLSSREPGV